MKYLRLIAGAQAYAKIEAQGLTPELFTQVLAASGGPKWLGIAGLDKYLFGEFFKNRQAPLYTMGTSSGAWRLACFGQASPLAAYQRLEQLYIHQRYEDKPSPREISQRVKPLVQGILGDSGAQEIIENPVVQSHFIVCQGRHLNRFSNRAAQSLGLLATAATNFVSRNSLNWHFSRKVFSTGNGGPFAELTDLPTQYLALSKQNAQEVLLATGSIPLVLAPVPHIAGLGKGAFYDGGITDYHFDFPIKESAGLTIYPHFYPQMTPGWFDKSLSWRRAKSNYSHGLILAPSNDFVQQLPYNKVPDRADFSKMDTEQRIQYWLESVALSARLAEELDQIVSGQNIMAHLEKM